MLVGIAWRESYRVRGCRLNSYITTREVFESVQTTPTALGVLAAKFVSRLLAE